MLKDQCKYTKKASFDLNLLQTNKLHEIYNDFTKYFNLDYLCQTWMYGVYATNR